MRCGHKRKQHNVMLPVCVRKPDGEVLTAENMHSTVLWNITSCRLVEIY